MVSPGLRPVLPRRPATQGKEPRGSGLGQGPYPAIPRAAIRRWRPSGPWRRSSPGNSTWWRRPTWPGRTACRWRWWKGWAIPCRTCRRSFPSKSLPCRRSTVISTPGSRMCSRRLTGLRLHFADRFGARPRGQVLQLREDDGIKASAADPADFTGELGQFVRAEH